MKSPVRFMARGLAEGGDDEKGEERPLHSGQAQQLRPHPEEPRPCAASRRMRAAYAAVIRDAAKRPLLRMRGVVVARAIILAAARAMRRRCGPQPSNKPSPRRCPRRS